MAAPHQAQPDFGRTPYDDEKANIDHLNGARVSSDEEKPTDLVGERNALLANLPDPDMGKSEEEKRKIDRRLMWKVDVCDLPPLKAPHQPKLTCPSPSTQLWIVPWLSLLYLLSFLDRTNIGNARLAGMEDDLDMEGTDYNMSLTIFFISYAVAEPITNTLLKRLTPRIFFTGIILLWGIIMTLMGLVTNYAGLLAARFFLGIAEAGLFPGAFPQHSAHRLAAPFPQRSDTIPQA
jgi:hypothetical protein